MTALTLGLRAPRRRLLWILLASITVIGALFIGVYPTRTYLAQRSALQKADHQLDVLQTENAKLGQQAADLNTDSQIEALARDRYGLRLPGEEAYFILPAPPAKITVPPVWPFTGLSETLESSQAASSP